MAEQHAVLEQPEHQAETSTAEPKKSPFAHGGGRGWRVLGLVFVCFVASFLGAWLFVGSGLVRLDATQTINQNRQQIVSQQGATIQDVYKKVNPSTVAITTEAVVNTGGLFRSATTQTQESAGSGIIISKDGYVLTNKHVIADATQVTVIASDGTQYSKVRVVGTDPFNDIAFLKIDGVNNLTPAQLGDSAQVQPGQQVVAIGNALGIFRNSVTSGIISGIGRPLQAQDSASGSAEQLENLFQTDAAINPGNSGGPLVDLGGNVIGINTATSTDGQSIGFAIPINDAKNEINSVLHSGKIVKAYLGVRYVLLDPETAQQLNVSQTTGALVMGGAGQPGVLPGSPAAKAGVQEGDIITKMNNQTIDSQHGLSSQLAQMSPGDKVQLTILRGGKQMSVAVTLEAYQQ